MEESIYSQKHKLGQAETDMLVAEITRNLKTGEETETILSTDEKVLARVTDGIYRQPSSALRELISNAYDADASSVFIETDAPRFENITVRDDGNGMSIEALGNLIKHIGGSAKRSSNKPELGVTDEHDPTLSPNKKRKLIGKIGIGLFSVAQLTREFTIITKQQGRDYYIIADVVLGNFSEEELGEYERRGESFKTGRVKIKTEETSNVEAHGTDILLKNIKKSARDQLKSVDIWLQESKVDIDDGEAEALEDIDAPTYHIGCTYKEDQDFIFKEPNLPWGSEDSAEEKFLKLYEGMRSLAAVTVSPKLRTDLDNYLNMIWTLSMSAPIDYIGKHPFGLAGEDFPVVYAISNQPKGKCKDIVLGSGEKIGARLGLSTPVSSANFSVCVDGILLKRPVDFKNLPTTSAAVKDPILFVGSAKVDAGSVPADVSGGALAFDAYIMWCPKIVPKEHNGVLLRINNAAGVFYDPTFMKYQIAEYVINGQLTAEIFVHKGLDSALNIDRESFNISHPHYQIIMRWLHDALRQATAKYKQVKRDANAKNKVERITYVSGLLTDRIDEIAQRAGKNSDDLRTVRIVEVDESDDRPVADAYKINREEFADWSGGAKAGTGHGKTVEEKMKAIIQVLDAFDVLEGMSQAKQHELFRAIVRILSVEGY